MKTLSLCEKRHPLLVDYCHFLSASFHNFTQTYFADHIEKWSHDQLNRLLREQRISAGDLWRSVKNDIELDPDGYLLFDDTVVSKPYARNIEAVLERFGEARHPRHRSCDVCLCQSEDRAVLDH